MKIKWISIALTGALLCSAFSGSVVMAEETQAASQEGGTLSSLVGALESGVSGLLSEAGAEDGLSAELGNLAGGLLGSLSENSGAVSDLLSGMGIVGEDGSLDLSSLLAEGGPVSDLLGAIGSLKTEDIEKLFAEDGPLSSILSLVQNEDGSIDVQSLISMAGMLLGGGSTDAKTYANMGPKPTDAIDQYLLDYAEQYYSDYDVALTLQDLANMDFTEDGRIRMFGDFWNFNYQEQDGQLVFCSGGVQTATFTLSLNEDGSAYVVDAVDAAVDGTDNWTDITRLCEEMGMTTD